MRGVFWLKERISQNADKRMKRDGERIRERKKVKEMSKREEKGQQKMINAIDKFQVAGPASQNTRITECASINRFAVDSVT